MRSRTHRRPATPHLQYEAGVSLVEVLFALALFSIMGLGMAYSSITALHTRGRTVANSTALQIAHETLENFAAINPGLLDDTYDQSEIAVTRNGLRFLRSINVRIETDRARTVEVLVQSPAFGVRAELSSSFALWGRR